MAITENIVKGKKYRVCIDADKNEWDRVSMWTAASDVELESGDSVETALNSLNENLTASDNLQFKFGKDGDGNYGYYGADGSLIPFKSGFTYDDYQDNLYFYSTTEGDAIYQDYVGYGRYSIRTSNEPALLTSVNLSTSYPCQVGIITISQNGISCTGGEYGKFTEITGTSITRKGHTVYWGYGSGSVGAKQTVVKEINGNTHVINNNAGLLCGDGVTEFGLYLADKILFNE